MEDNPKAGNTKDAPMRKVVIYLLVVAILSAAIGFGLSFVLQPEPEKSELPQGLRRGE